MVYAAVCSQLTGPGSTSKYPRMQHRICAVNWLCPGAGLTIKALPKQIRVHRTKLTVAAAQQKELVNAKQLEDGTVLYTFGSHAEAAQARHAEQQLAQQQNTGHHQQHSNDLPHSLPQIDIGGHDVREQHQNGSAAAHQEAEQEQHHVQEQEEISAVTEAVSLADAVADPRDIGAPLEESHESGQRELLKLATTPVQWHPDNATEDSTAVPAIALAHYDADALHHMKVSELRNICKELQLKGFSKLRKEELITLVLETQEGGAAVC